MTLGSAATSNGDMDWVLVWTIVAAVVGALALIGVVYAVVGYYRDHPKRQLEYTVRSRRLVQSAPKAKLEIRVNGIDVPDPYFVEFRLVSNSRADIPSTAFDAGKDLTIRVSPGGAFVLGEEGARGQIETNGADGSDWEWREFYVGPQLIRKRSTLALDFISNGEPGVTVHSPLIDVEVLNVTKRPSGGDIVKLVAFSLVMFVMALITIGPRLLGAQSELGPTVPLILGGFYIVATIATVFLLIRAVRWKRRATMQNSNAPDRPDKIEAGDTRRT